MVASVELKNITLTSIGSGVRVIGAIGGVWYGYSNGGQVLHQSTDNGATWPNVGNITLGNPLLGSGVVRSIFLCDDGEVLVLREDDLIRSTGWQSGTISWTVKVSVSSITGGTFRINVTTATGTWDWEVEEHGGQ